MAGTKRRKEATLPPVAQALTAAARGAVVVNLFEKPAHPNAALLKRQYEAQRAMLEANLASKAATTINPDLLKAQHQPATRTPTLEATIREQANKQEETIFCGYKNVFCLV